VLFAEKPKAFHRFNGEKPDLRSIPGKLKLSDVFLCELKKHVDQSTVLKMFLLDQQRYTEEQSHTPLFTPFTGNGTYKSTKWNVLSRTWWSKMDGS